MEYLYFSVASFVPSFALWMVLVHFRNIDLSRYPIKDLFYDDRVARKYDEDEASSYYYQCVGKYHALFESSPSGGSFGYAGIFYLILAGSIIGFASRLVAIMCAGIFVLSPLLAFGVNHIAYRKRSVYDQLSSFELDDSLKKESPLDFFQEYSTYFDKCSKYIKSRREAMYFCFIVGSVQTVILLFLCFRT